MTMKFLDPKAASNLLSIANSSYRPKEIVNLKDEIEGEIRAAELNTSVTGVIDLDRLSKVVQMKLKLDSLCIDWANGKLS